MNWLAQLFRSPESVPTSILVLALVASLGLAIGSLSIRGVKVGVAGVLFVGIAFGHFGVTIHHDILHFAREFGLILFVYAVGVAVGPGFLASLREGGLKLNAVAATIVLSGAILTFGISRIAGIPMPIAVGMFSGATTNTPSLAAATQTLAEAPPVLEEAVASLRQADPERAARLPPAALMTDSVKKSLRKEASRMPGLGYAVAYPFGVAGIILSMLLMRIVLGAKSRREEDGSDTPSSGPLVSENFEVANAALVGRRLGDVSVLSSLDLVVSRIRKGNEVRVAQSDDILERGDILLAVGTREAMIEMRTLLGATASVDLRDQGDALNVQWLTLSEKALVGRTVDEIRLTHSTGTRLTRVRRGDVELHPGAGLRLHFGDALRVVGTEGGLAKARSAIGDSRSALQHPDIVVVFLGIALGVVLGSVPLAVPGIPVPVKLGLAGGPLIVAILLSRMLRIGKVVTTLPLSANNALKELGITLFLAAVGLKSGESFVSTLSHGQGLEWMAWAAMITVLPLALGMLLARLAFKLPFPSLLGTMAGSMTDPPALAFSNTIASAQATGIAYAAVYPLTMLLRIVAAQILVLAGTL